MSDTKPDLDAIEARANASAGVAGFTTIHHAVAAEDVPALVAYARTLEAENERLSRVDLEPSRQMLVDDAEGEAAFWGQQAKAAEAERDQLRDTLARRSAALDRLAQRLDQIRALAEREQDRQGLGYRTVRVRDLLRVLDGDQRTEQP